MKLKHRIINALQLTSIVNGTETLNLESQNQGKNLKEIADLGNRLDLLSNDIQSQQNRHTEYRNEMFSQPSTRTLDTMPDDDLRHPYSAHRPKQKHVEKNFEESRSAQKAISDSIERTKAIFYHLKERYITEYDMERKYTQTNLQDAQSLYKDFRHLKDRLLDNESFMQEQREAIHVFLEEDSAPNRNKYLRKYLEMYNTEINNLSLDKLKIDSHIDDCEKIVNEIKEAIKNMESRSVNAFTTESPTISPQEKNILTRSKDLSTQFNKLTQEINHLRGQVEELESDMFWENQFPGHESPNRMKDIKAKLTHIRNDQLPKLEGERTFVQSEIIKEKHYIESLVREEKMSLSKAIEYRKEYEKLIHRFEESISQVDNERNKRERVVRPNFSENTLTTATTPASPTPAINVATPEKTTLAINATTSMQADDLRHPYSAYSPASTDVLNSTEVFDGLKNFFSKLTIDDSSNATRPKSTDALNRTEVLDELKSFFSKLTIDDSSNVASSKSADVLNRTEVIDGLKNFFSNLTIDDSSNAARPKSTDALNRTEVLDELKSFFGNLTIDDSSNATRPKSTEVLNRTEVIDGLKNFFSNLTIDDSSNATRPKSTDALNRTEVIDGLKNFFSNLTIDDSSNVASSKSTEVLNRTELLKRKKRDLSSFSEKLESIATNTNHQVKSKKFLYTQQLGSR